MRKLKSDTREYHNAWYQANKEKRKTQIKAYQKRKQEYVTNIKTITPCMDCGGMFPPCAMDFDHIKEKDFDICGSRSRNMGYKTLEEEMAKCELVCANCHRIRTYNRRRVSSVVERLTCNKEVQSSNL